GEAVFRSVLVRECRRAERSNDACMLLLVAIDGGNSAATWRHAIAALSASRRETDVLGWFEHGRAIGLILAHSGASRAAARRAVEDRVRGELVKRLDAPSMSRVTISVHAHPVAPDGDNATDPLPAIAGRDLSRSIAAGLKRALDIIGSLALLLLFGPVLLVV